MCFILVKKVLVLFLFNCLILSLGVVFVGWYWVMMLSMIWGCVIWMGEDILVFVLFVLSRNVYFIGLFRVVWCNLILVVYSWLGIWLLWCDNLVLKINGMRGVVGLNLDVWDVMVLLFFKCFCVVFNIRLLVVMKFLECLFI